MSSLLAFKFYHISSDGATPGRATALALALAIALLCFGNNVKQKIKILPYLTAHRFICF